MLQPMLETLPKTVLKASSKTAAKTAPLLHRAPSPLGDILLAATDRGLYGLWFDGQKHLPDMRHWPSGHNAVIDLAQLQMQQYFAKQRSTFDLPLDLSAGTAFQQTVWQALLAIPCGGHSSYGAIAQRIRNPKAVRAVGAAVGRNPISVIVPCHRVLGASGALTGYAGGLARKTALLQLEGVLPEGAVTLSNPVIYGDLGMQAMLI